MGNSEPAKFLPFHFVKFASLTSLVKDKPSIRQPSIRQPSISQPSQLVNKHEDTSFHQPTAIDYSLCSVQRAACSGHGSKHCTQWR